MQVLYIDDIEGDLVLVSKLLKKHLPLWDLKQYGGLIAAKNDFANQTNSDNVVSLDLRLPRFSGLPTLDVLLGFELDQPIIVTGSEGENLGVKAFKRGAQGYLLKGSLQGNQLKRSRKYSLARFSLSSQPLETNKIKDRLFSIMGHDLRSPLAGIMSLVDYLIATEDEMKEQELRDILQMIKQSTLNTKNLLDNLLFWYRLPLNQLSFSPKPILVEEAINDVLSILDANRKTKGINISVIFEPNDQIYADPKMLACILRNILSNAIKFSHPDGKVQIFGNSSANHYTISITDSGIGIPTKMQQNIFSGTEVNGREGTDGESSTGLGLMLAQGFSARHGGEITVKSVAHKGSTFRLQLPN